MKKALILICIFIIFGCSSNDVTNYPLHYKVENQTEIDGISVTLQKVTVHMFRNDYNTRLSYNIFNSTESPVYIILDSEDFLNTGEIKSHYFKAENDNLIRLKGYSDPKEEVYFGSMGSFPLNTTITYEIPSGSSQKVDLLYDIYKFDSFESRLVIQKDDGNELSFIFSFENDDINGEK